jgi:hypothetical protein
MSGGVRETAQGSSEFPMAWLSTATDACTWLIERTIVFRFSILAGASWSNGRAAERGPYGIVISKSSARVFMIDGGTQPTTPPDRSGVVILDLAGNVVDRFGTFGNQDGQFMMGHDIAVNASDEVYVVDVVGGRLQRFSRQSSASHQ